MISNQQEYKLANGQVISIQFDEVKQRWEVACWNTDDTHHWYKEFEFKDTDKAQAEFERWRINERKI